MYVTDTVYSSAHTGGKSYDVGKGLYYCFILLFIVEFRCALKGIRYLSTGAEKKCVSHSANYRLLTVVRLVV